MRLLYVLVATLAIPVGYTQGSYVGVGGTWQTSSAYPSVPLVSVQIGGPTAPEFGSLEVRAALDTVLLFSNLGVDAFASVRLPDASLRIYFGGGPDVLVLITGHAPPGREGAQVFFGAHGTVGLEVLAGVLTRGVRLYAELQPAAALLYGEPVFGLRARAGLNFYY